jgi:CheY-like chemotaxis protein
MTDPRRAQIVIVEDNNADIILFKEALQAAGIVFDLSRFIDGQDCIESLAASRDHQRPDLIIIDLPRVTVLKSLKLFGQTHDSTGCR